MLLEQVFYWIAHYKYVGIYLLQFLGILGFPIPDDSTLVFMGYFVQRHRLELVPTLVAAFLGSASGVTLSYLLGHTFGLFLLHKYGVKIGITEAKLEKVHAWFRRVGKWSLAIGFFIPGIRHLNGYVAGSSKLEFPVFAMFAYPGAVLWTSFFVLTGYWLGEGWEKLGDQMRSVTLMLLSAAALMLAVVLLRRVRKRWINGEKQPIPPQERG